MVALNVVEVKQFMGHLLLREVFDNFLVSEIEVLTSNRFKINGRLNKAWFDETQNEELQDEKLQEKEYLEWKDLKGIVYHIIKGNKTPHFMKIVFQLSKENQQKVLERVGHEFSMEDVDGLFLNIRYEKGELTLITGTSMQTFTLNKALEHEWDENIKKYLKHFEIAFEEN
ncbi:MAG: DUF5721 family protein [Velocimicrobium sp.]